MLWGNFMSELENSIVEILTEYIKNNGTSDISAHDWYHIERVLKISEKINKKEKANIFIITMIALLHDVFDHKFYPNADVAHETRKLLSNLNVFEEIKASDYSNIIHSIENLSFKGGFNTEELSKEGKIVQDADRLDSIGAIAIARTFAYGGKKDRAIYDPLQGIVEILTEEEYLKKDRHSINHFYEKLLKLKDNMNTEIGKQIAQKRHEFMEQYLKQFFIEWDVKD